MKKKKSFEVPNLRLEKKPAPCQCHWQRGQPGRAVGFPIGTRSQDPMPSHSDCCTGTTHMQYTSSPSGDRCRSRAAHWIRVTG